MVLSMSMASLATDSDLGREGLLGPTDLFVDICKNLFEQEKDYRVIDNEGNDITTSFVNKYSCAYKSENYDLIWRDVRDNVDVIMWSNPEQIRQTRMDISNTVSDSFYKLGETQSKPQTTFEMIYTVSGNYKYHDSNGEISYHDNGSVCIDSFSIGALYTYKQINTSTSAKLASNKKSVTFSAQFSVAVSLAPNGGTIWTDNMGPYSGSVTGRSY